MQFKKITDIFLAEKVVFIRTDMNVPITQGQITDDTRIKASLDTIKYALEQGSKVIVATHLGRPLEGACDIKDSVTPIANKLSQLLNCPVPVIKDFTLPINFSTSKVVMLENVRCNYGEKANSLELGQAYAKLCNVFVHDAFATAHRAEASTDAIGYYAQEVCAGLLLAKELEALTKAITQPIKPVVAIVGGAKVSTKLNILNNLADKVDYLIVGGGILNTFLAAAGFKVGKSLLEVGLIEEAKGILAKMQKRNALIPLPQEVVIAKEFSASAVAREKNIKQINADEMILDIGHNFARHLATLIQTAGTIIWNGPLGVFEFDQFAYGTQIVAESIAQSKAFSLAGGGDTIAAINKFKLMNKISYVSTAGGALLEFLEGKSLPAIKLLNQKA